MDVINEVAAERLRQVHVEGFDVPHDDDHSDGELARAAAVYCMTASHATRKGDDSTENYPSPGGLWPWHEGWYKPKTPRRDLLRAAALIVAEIERLDRRAKK